MDQVVLLAFLALVLTFVVLFFMPGVRSITDRPLFAAKSVALRKGSGSVMRRSDPWTSVGLGAPTAPVHSRRISTLERARHTTKTAWLSITVAAALLASGCVGLADGQDHIVDDTTVFAAAPALRVADELGDARDLRWNALHGGPACRIACVPLPPAPDQVGVPAPWFDLTEVAFVAETEDAVQVELLVASLLEGVPQLESMPGHNRIFEYWACWIADAEYHEPGQPAESVTGLAQFSESGQRCARLHITSAAGGPHPSATFHITDARCGSIFYECAWPIDFKISYGVPATITFEVPKRLMVHDGAPLIMEDLEGSTRWYSLTKSAPLWHAAQSHSVDGSYDHAHGATGGLGDVPDRTQPAAAAIHLTPTAAPFPGAPTAKLVAEPGNVWGKGGTHDRPELDLLGTELWVEDDEVVLRYTVAELNEWPVFAAHWDTLVTVSGQPLLETGVRKDTNNLEPYGYMGQCIGFHCDEAKEIRVPVELEPGSPATMTMRFPAEEFGLHQGVSINFVWTITMLAEYSLMVGEHDDETMADIHAMSLVDAHVGATPYVVGGGEPLPLVVGDAHDH